MALSALWMKYIHGQARRDCLNGRASLDCKPFLEDVNRMALIWQAAWWIVIGSGWRHCSWIRYVSN